MLVTYVSDLDQESKHIIYTPTEGTVKKPFYIHECGYYRCGSKFRVEHTQRDNYLILFTVSGVGIVVCDRFTYRVPTGSAILINCSKRVQYYTTGPKRWEMYWCYASSWILGVAPFPSPSAGHLPCRLAAGLSASPALCGRAQRFDFRITGLKYCSHCTIPAAVCQAKSTIVHLAFDFLFVHPRFTRMDWISKGRKESSTQSSSTKSSSSISSSMFTR